MANDMLSNILPSFIIAQNSALILLFRKIYKHPQPISVHGEGKGVGYLRG